MAPALPAAAADDEEEAAVEDAAPALVVIGGSLCAARRRIRPPVGLHIARRQPLCSAALPPTPLPSAGSREGRKGRGREPDPSGGGRPAARYMRGLAAVCQIQRGVTAPPLSRQGRRGEERMGKKR